LATYGAPSAAANIELDDDLASHLPPATPMLAVTQACGLAW
jgi:hypothetical protein